MARYVKVTEAKTHNNLTGKSVWKLTLACGHQVQRPRIKDRSAPTAVVCHQCSKEPARG